MMTSAVVCHDILHFSARVVATIFHLPLDSPLASWAGFALRRVAKSSKSRANVVGELTGSETVTFLSVFFCATESPQ
jgi:hypothetical protein